MAFYSTYLEKRAVELGTYIVETGATIRETGKRFNVSKSAVHLDVSVRLADIDPDLYYKVQEVLDHNYAERCTRGGKANALKWKERRDRDVL